MHEIVRNKFLKLNYLLKSNHSTQTLLACSLGKTQPLASCSASDAHRDLASCFPDSQGMSWEPWASGQLPVLTEGLPLDQDKCFSKGQTLPGSVRSSGGHRRPGVIAQLSEGGWFPGHLQLESSLSPTAASKSH